MKREIKNYVWDKFKKYCKKEDIEPTIEKFNDFIELNLDLVI